MLNLPFIHKAFTKKICRPKRFAVGCMAKVYHLFFTEVKKF